MNITLQFIHLQAEKQEKKFVATPFGVGLFAHQKLTA
jgi:hypothetical protein